jgi:hypothetical protein
MQRGPLDLPADEFGVLAARVVEEATRYLDRLGTSPVRPDSSGAETLMYFDRPPPRPVRDLPYLTTWPRWPGTAAPETGASSAT